MSNYLKFSIINLKSGTFMVFSIILGLVSAQKRSNEIHWPFATLFFSIILSTTINLK